MSEHAVDVNAANFEQAVIEDSKRLPVIVDFWAPWCAPCRALGPILEKLAAELQGRFRLVKINSDENQELAARYGVRGIPNVKAFVNGQLVDEFSGALPEPLVRQFIARVVPSPAEELRLRALEVYRGNKDAQQALALLAEAAAADGRNELVRIDAAQILIDCGEFEDARSMLESLSPLTQMQDRVTALKAKIEFSVSAANAPDEGSLKQRIAQDAGDLEARLQLARLRIARQDYAAALEDLLEIVRRDRSFNDDAARKTMLQVFNLLGNQGELVSTYRKRLASAMY